MIYGKNQKPFSAIQQILSTFCRFDFFKTLTRMYLTSYQVLFFGS